MGAIAAFCSGPAHAQDAATHLPRYTPAEISDNIHLSAGDRARAAIDDYAMCIAKADPHQALAFIAMPAGKAADRVAARLAVNDCLLGGEMRFSQFLFRGSLARSFYRQMFAQKAPILAESDLDLSAESKEDGPDRAAAEKHAAGLEFGECVVRADPEHSRDLTLAPVATRREHDAFAALTAAFSSCVARGTTVEFSKAALSAMIGEALYRLSAPLPSSPGSR